MGTSPILPRSGGMPTRPQWTADASSRPPPFRGWGGVSDLALVSRSDVEAYILRESMLDRDSRPVSGSLPDLEIPLEMAVLLDSGLSRFLGRVPRFRGLSLPEHS